MSSADKTKLNGIEAGAQKNPTNYVTTDTNQDITGNKAFNIRPNGANVGVFTVYNDDVEVFRVIQSNGTPTIEIDNSGEGNIAITFDGDSGNDGDVLVSGGAGVTPHWQSLSNYASKTYVNNAIANAITTALNTPV